MGGILHPRRRGRLVGPSAAPPVRVRAMDFGKLLGDLDDSGVQARGFAELG
jgi:hypothetical protein